MARYPDALWMPLTVDKSRWKLVPLRVNLHVAVSEAKSLRGYFNEARSRPDSHFYVRKDGTVEQYVDTALIAYADLEGNGSTISVETQGGVTRTQSEPWTPAQVEALAKLYAWAVKTHGIAVQIADDSRPGKTSHGLSWHRLGCDGNFPGRPLHGRVSGGRLYSRAVGKVCPGDAKIRQVPDVYARAVQILGGHGVAGITIPPTVQEDDVTTDAQMRQINTWIENIHKDIKNTLPGLVADAVWTFVTSSESRSGWTMLRRATDAAQATNATLPAIAGRVGAPIDTDALVHSLAETLTEALSGSVSGQVVEDALRRVFADAANPQEA